MPEDMYDQLSLPSFSTLQRTYLNSYENLKMCDFPLPDYNPIQSTSRNTLEPHFFFLKENGNGEGILASLYEIS